MSKGSTTKKPTTRRASRSKAITVDNAIEARFLKRALETYAENIRTQPEWSADQPFTREECVEIVERTTTKVDKLPFFTGTVGGATSAHHEKEAVEGYSDEAAPVDTETNYIEAGV